MYAYIVAAFCLVSLGWHLNSDHDEFMAACCGVILIMPLVGRVAGWW